jgi:hypothetical protein
MAKYTISYLGNYLNVLGILEFGFRLGRVLGQQKSFVVWI